ncbi:hypothetical protein C1645_747398 [Glomus cerebriforme]|uniref:Uncharacterized protein n=1 Tax=Glomus cerebriforme TaxID=658196 RepID=A0A397TMY6_9GLOM|nr:hypothetical protein C1645_747398 [Glomus cerebriforme]
MHSRRSLHWFEAGFSCLIMFMLTIFRKKSFDFSLKMMVAPIFEYILDDQLFCFADSSEPLSRSTKSIRYVDNSWTWDTWDTFAL